LFQWYLYLTPRAAELPGDDLPHFRWVDDAEGPIAIPGVARHWIELPSPMSSPMLPPACWVQPGQLDPTAPREADPTAFRGVGAGPHARSADRRGVRRRRAAPAAASPRRRGEGQLPRRAAGRRRGRPPRARRPPARRGHRRTLGGGTDRAPRRPAAQPALHPR